jgi:putative ABC transport system permease protein
MGRVREIGAAVAPELELSQLATSAAADEERSVGLRLLALMVVSVMASVLLLSAAGVYALMSFLVASRRREIGIRGALGAAPHRVLVATVRRAGAQLVGGALAGLALVEALARGALGASLLFAGESPYVLPGVVAVLMLFGILGATGPVLRGLAIQPREALQAD